MKNKLILSIFLVLSAHPACAGGMAELAKTSGIKGGIIVHLGCGDGAETAKMRFNDSYLVHGLATDAATVAKARETIRSKNLYGPVSVAQFDGRSLPYGANIVNLLIAESLGDVPEAEAMRVLAPGGAMIVGGRLTTKPRPANIDDWPQYLNKADNNAVAMDSVAGPPRLLQWVNDPVWCRSHMGIPTVASMVTSNGRLFSIEDAAPPDNPFLPAAFRIVARDAFNGMELWSRKITRWESVTMYIKCQPVQQQRRMAVVGDTLYCTFELEGPVSAVNAATGEVIKVHKNTSPTQEVAYADGILYLNVGDRFPTAAYNIVKTKSKPFVEGKDPSQPFYGGGFSEGYAPQIEDKENPVSDIIAIDPKTGKELWAVRDINTYTAGTLSIKGDYAVYQSSGGLHCVDSKTGKPIWSKKKAVAHALGHDSKTPGTVPNTVVITDDKVFAVVSDSAGQIASTPKSTLHAHALEDGRELWQAPVVGNYEASADVCHVNGSLWIGGRNPVQLDPETGEEIRKIVQKMTGPMGHDRCYRNYITERYFINSKTGGADFLDLESGREFPNHWTRGGCGSGVLPANGLVYSTPYSCQCSMGAMFPGMNAYASPQPALARPDEPIAVKRSPRLEKGPAYGTIGKAKPAGDSDWPMFRHDGFRSGITRQAVPDELKVKWVARLSSKPGALTIAAGMVFACDADSHAVHALDEQSGEVLWSFTADGRVDSPPAYHEGMVLFGCRAGRVYCLRASDGELAWRFTDLPERLIGAYNQLESTWPVSGSVLVVKNRLYFAAGRSSYLDGGIFLYAMDPASGKLLDSRACYGPFDDGTGFPVGGDAGFKNDILVSDGSKLYLRHKAVDLELADADAAMHIIPTGGFLDGNPQHRTNWGLASSTRGARSGDILVSDGKDYFGVEGFPLMANHSYFDPRNSGYKLFAGTQAAANASPKVSVKGKRGKRRKVGLGGAGGKELWNTGIPITGKAIAKAGNTLLVAGEPMKFAEPSWQKYVAAYNGELGGRLLLISAKDGKRIASHRLEAAPVWDSLAVANGSVFISLADGSVQCLGE